MPGNSWHDLIIPSWFIIQKSESLPCLLYSSFFMFLLCFTGSRNNSCFGIHRINEYARKQFTRSYNSFLIHYAEKRKPPLFALWRCPKKRTKMSQEIRASNIRRYILFDWYKQWTSDENTKKVFQYVLYIWVSTQTAPLKLPNSLISVFKRNYVQNNGT